MNNGNFNASELSNIYIALTDVSHYGFSQLKEAGNPTVGSFKSTVESYIRSEDSNLAQTWKNTGELTAEIDKKADAIIAKIWEEIQAYAKATVQNEEATATAVGEVNSDIIGYKEELEQIEI